MNAKQPLIGLSLDQLREVAAQCGLPRFAAGQMASWLYKKRVTSIDQMTDISLAGRSRLAEKYYIGRKAPLTSARSTDGTVKYLFPGVGGHDVEAVYIPDRDRATLCVSSQAGCKMACAFCMTGRQGWHGQLSTAAIINQVLSVDDSESLTNIVFMGMGEPLDNLDAVIGAIDVLTAKWGLAWSPKRITVSTVGVLPALKRLLDTTSVHIAVSLHLPDVARRAEMMPAERAWPLHKVIDLLRDYDFSHQRRLSFEYIMWQGINDSPRQAMALARLLKGLDCRVNLIRFHAIPDSPLRPAPLDEMEAFRDRLNELGITATIRASRGEDIMAACGMLAGRKNSEN
ncbi:MAG: 23S rRNA (adenine(2503)-C(2))-methyltransferase RlmN [Paramuribaculum sp.]|nr:23S rRNA (adenine(2503)-C(2))-methyltransferase RlmN [Paramuribaculum sp.]MDE7470152.1 23S rRNA (adenine(2503)-C(2))-methyltransferase RlmN [Paramuribaculum sp.]